MNSERVYTSSSYLESVTVEARDGAGLAEKVSKISEETGKNLVDSYKQLVKDDKKAQEKQRQQNQMKSMMEYMERMRKSQNEGSQFDPKKESDLQIKLLRRLLAALNGKKLDRLEELEDYREGDVLDLRSSNFKKAEMVAAIRGNGQGAQSAAANQIKGQAAAAQQAGAALQIGTNVNGSVWHRVTFTSGFHAEMEDTAFKTEGMVTTQDGRSISFGVQVNMSRSLMEKVDIINDVSYIKTDPLIINMDSNVASVSDMKFRFDLDADGKKENISFAGPGSGFLALDKNGNGKIDDGRELFGTQSGDGFADLAEYDEDGNMWIDENDSVFNQLRVWVMDEDGNEKLLDLASADVGAIYLGSADTEFSLKGEDNRTNGIIQKTGLYLRESGSVGTVNHVDLTM